MVNTDLSTAIRRKSLMKIEIKTKDDKSSIIIRSRFERQWKNKHAHISEVTNECFKYKTSFVIVIKNYSF